MKTQSVKKVAVFFLALVLVLGMAPDFIVADADDTIVFDAADLEGRTLQEVANRYSVMYHTGETYDERYSSTYYTVSASLKDPYEPGVLTDDTLLAMRAMVNYYRWLTGVDEWEEITYHSDESLQAQAFDRNFEFAHYISQDSKPDDMPSEIWDKGYNMDHNILASGYSASGSVIGWINEGYNAYYGTWDTTGHRFTLLSPTISDVKFGYSGNVGIGKIMESNGFYYDGQLYNYSGSFLDRAYVAYPAPGYMPTELVYASEAVWQIQINERMVEVDTDSVSVSIKNESTGETFVRNKTDNTLKATPTMLSFAQPPLADGSYYGKYYGKYTVTVAGLKEKSSGKNAIIKYTVNFVKIKDYAPSIVVEAGTNIGKFWLYNVTYDDIDKVALLAPDYVLVKSETGSTFKLPVSGKWQAEKTDDKTGVLVNSASETDLPSNLYDKDGVLKSIRKNYEIDVDPSYFSANTFTIDTKDGSNTVPSGSQVTFKYKTGNSSFSQIKVYRFETDGSGNHVPILVFDSKVDSYTWEEYSSYRYMLTFVKDVLEKDSGEYVVVAKGKPEDYYNAIEITFAQNILTVLPCKHVFSEKEDIVVNPTDTSQGYTKHVCSVCGYEYIDNYKPAVSGGIVLISGSNYSEDGCVVGDIASGSSVESVLKNFENSEELQIIDNDGKLVYSGLTGTGYEVRLVRDSNVCDTKILVVPGDNSGDGLIDVVDVKLALNVSLGKQTLNGAFNIASNVNNDDVIDVVDVKLILNVSLGKQKNFMVPA